MPLYRVTTEFTGPPGAPYFNTLYFDTLDGSEQQAADAVGVFWGAVDGLLVDELAWTTLPEVVTVDETDGGILAVITTNVSSGAGANVGEPGATVLQALITWSTGVPFDGRILRGRTFIPGMALTAQDNGTLEPSQRTTFQNAATALIEDLNSGLSIWHRPIVADPDADPPIAGRLGAQADVSNATVASKFAVLRSRRD